MNKRLSRTLLAVGGWGWLLFAVSPRAIAAFQDPGWGARPTGMGGAFSAVADDSNAPLYNPAGLVQIQWNEFSASYAQLFSGLTLYSGDDVVHLDQNYLAYMSKPIPHFGSWGVSWASFRATHLYREDTVALSYARNLGDFLPAFDNALAFGMNLKYLHRGMTLDALSAADPTFASGDTATGVAADVGLLYHPTEGALAGWRLALAGQNINQPNVGFQEVDRVPAELRLGVAYQSPTKPFLIPALDFTRRDRVMETHAGLECWLFHESIGLRGGVSRDEGSAGLSYYQSFNKNFGFRLDYAFTVPYYVQGSAGSHRLAVTLYL